MSSEAVVTLAHAVAGQSSSNSPGQPLQAAHGFSLTDIARFEAAYRGGAAGVGTAAPVGTPQAVQAAAAGGSVLESPGLSAVMNQLDYMNGFAKRIAEDTRAIAASGEMTPGDMLMLTVRSHELLFHCELTSNIASRTSDGVQQLFKQQS